MSARQRLEHRPRHHPLSSSRPSSLVFLRVLHIVLAVVSRLPFLYCLFVVEHRKPLLHAYPSHDPTQSWRIIMIESARRRIEAIRSRRGLVKIAYRCCDSWGGRLAWIHHSLCNVIMHRTLWVVYDYFTGCVGGSEPILTMEDGMLDGNNGWICYRVEACGGGGVT